MEICVQAVSGIRSGVMFEDPKFFSDLSLPPKFTAMRPQQAQMAERIALSMLEAKTTVHAAPTGVGKTLAYVAAGRLAAERMVILTATKTLQNQILREFPKLVVDLRGASNFDCHDHPGLDCGLSRRLGHHCRECPYQQQLESAMRTPAVVTNYAMWFALRKSGISFPVDLLVMDEAHMVMDMITSHCSVRLSHSELSQLQRYEPSPESDNPKQWAEWALKIELQVRKLLESSASDPKSARKAAALHDAVVRLSELPPTGAIVRRGNSDAALFASPVWASNYARRWLFGSWKTALVSATINKETCYLLGLSPGEFTLYDYESEFPSENGPVFLLPEPVLNHRSEKSDLKTAMQHALHWIKRRQDRKGIIHTGSYNRTMQMVEFLRGRVQHHLVWHANGADAAAAIRNYKLFAGPALLLSPSVGVGHDFPDTEAEFQVVLKAPFPDLSDPVVAARKENRPVYPQYVMAQNLVQMCGRGLRHRNDRCETLVVDGCALSVFKRRPGVFPQWFRKRVVQSESVHLLPDPLPKLI
jgi:Rad3-related DNA helicase